MKLIIMRHGEASWASSSDFDRALTFDGRKDVLTTTHRLLTIERVDRVIASPYLRAQQTGKIVADEMGCPLVTLNALTPDGHPRQIIEQLPESGSVLLASHMPVVGRLAGLLCDGVMGDGPGFGTACALILEMEFPAAGMATAISWVRPEE